MDVNETLYTIRELVQIHDLRPLTLAETILLCESFDAMDKWLCNFGFLPEPWQR